MQITQNYRKEKIEVVRHSASSPCLKTFRSIFQECSLSYIIAKSGGFIFSEKLTVATWHPVQDKPPDVEHSGMMINMQESDLMVVFPQDEKESIHKLNEFGEVIPPQDIHHLWR